MFGYAANLLRASNASLRYYNVGSRNFITNFIAWPGFMPNESQISLRRSSPSLLSQGRSSYPCSSNASAYSPSLPTCSNYYGGLGHTRPSMVAGLVAMVANIALNYALIEPRFGLPGGAWQVGVVRAAGPCEVTCRAVREGDIPLEPEMSLRGTS